MKECPLVRCLAYNRQFVRNSALPHLHLPVSEKLWRLAPSKAPLSGLPSPAGTISRPGSFPRQSPGRGSSFSFLQGLVQTLPSPEALRAPPTPTHHSHHGVQDKHFPIQKDPCPPAPTQGLLGPDPA